MTESAKVIRDLLDRLGCSDLNAACCCYEASAADPAPDRDTSKPYCVFCRAKDVLEQGDVLTVRLPGGSKLFVSGVNYRPEGGGVRFKVSPPMELAATETYQYGFGRDWTNEDPVGLVMSDLAHLFDKLSKKVGW